VSRTGLSISRWLIVLVIFFFIGRWLVSSWDQVRNAELTFSLPWLVVSVALLGAYLAGRALVWHYLTVLMGTAVPLRTATVAWFYSQLGKYIPGKVFLFLARLYFYVRQGRAAGPVSLAFGIELVGTLFAAIVIVLTALLTLHQNTSHSYRLELLGALTALCIVLHPRVLDRIVMVSARLLGKPSFPVTIAYGRLLEFLGLYLVNAGVFVAALYAFMRSFYPLEADSILIVVGAFFLASIVGMAALFVPSGLGVREGVFALLLTHVMPEAWAVLTAVCTRVWFSLVELTCIGLAAVAGARDRPDRADLERLRAAEPTL
jgi:uncharacterized membrane protein YbhN (UPF0104 family)